MIDISIILLVLFLFFILLALLTNEPFFYGLSGVLSIIFGVYLILEYVADTTLWMNGILGIMMFFLGFFMIILGAQKSIEGGK